MHHQTAAHYSAVECTRAKVPVCNVVAPTPQTESANRLKRATLDVNFLRSDSMCRRYMTVLSNIPPSYLGSEQEDRVSLLWLIFISRLASLLLRWKTANTAVIVLSFNFQVLSCSPMAAMSLLCTPSTVCSVSISKYDC